MPEQETAIAKAAPAAPVRYDPNDPVSLYLNEGIFGQLQRVAKLMAHSALVPSHLQTVWDSDGNIKEDKTSDCFLVCAQAFRWKMDPFAVAQSSFVLSGKLGYEGKLIAGVINSSPKLSKTLNYEYSGEGDGRKVRVYATLKGEDEPRSVEGTVRQWKQQRNPKWNEMPDQMLCYRGAREWARRHMPEVILGISSIDEVEEIAAAEPTEVVVEPENLDAFVNATVVETKDDPPEKDRGSQNATTTTMPEPQQATEPDVTISLPHCEACDSYHPDGECPVAEDDDYHGPVEVEPDADEEAVKAAVQRAQKRNGKKKKAAPKKKPAEDDVPPEDEEANKLFS